MCITIRNILGMLIILCSFAMAGCSGDDDSGSGGCPGSIISSCTDTCPQNCAAQGKTEVCVGAGYEPNRCCYCE